jgi:hypothetical protein
MFVVSGERRYCMYSYRLGFGTVPSSRLFNVFDLKFIRGSSILTATGSILNRLLTNSILIGYSHTTILNSLL